MSGIAEPYRTLFRNAKIQAAIREASQPHYSRIMGLYINDEHTPMTREDVARDFGEDAADKWEGIRTAISDFLDATK
ncbi:hypothetical protein [Paracoccus sulfuroxidans]|uniref:Uncharacterized protein n=1 Tax=Paracoccus sulfuroxidans TaxID=384678 RepID=A0A562NKN0_9RHOB|nr:hypothetical protein [Paracoccus sulfuroxidans]TWI32724.1 hypothetical protein IQ24_02599 [Paracoccus sulfuroxidans]